MAFSRQETGLTISLLHRMPSSSMPAINRKVLSRYPPRARLHGPDPQEIVVGSIVPVGLPSNTFSFPRRSSFIARKSVATNAHRAARGPSAASRRPPGCTPRRSCRRPCLGACQRLVVLLVILLLPTASFLWVPEPSSGSVLTSAFRRRSNAAAAAGCPLSLRRAP